MAINPLELIQFCNFAFLLVKMPLNCFSYHKKNLCESKRGPRHSVCCGLINHYINSFLHCRIKPSWREKSRTETALRLWLQNTNTLTDCRATTRWSCHCQWHPLFPALHVHAVQPWATSLMLAVEVFQVSLWLTYEPRKQDGPMNHGCCTGQGILWRWESV